MGKAAKSNPDRSVEQSEPTQRSAAATRTRILESAEAEFAVHGFDGVSVRQIALRAEVPVALINYHFGSKDGLYRAIFVARAPMIVDERIAGLRLAYMETDPDRMLELVIKAVLVPNLHMRSVEKNSNYARILAREVADPKAMERGIIQEFFDPVAHKVIEALKKALPDRRIEELHWGYQMMLGAMVYVMADIGRIRRLSDGRCDPDNDIEATRHLVTMLHAALKYGRVPAAD
ncbi:TetR/AcrR family transcriptional regulator [Mesorhizobium sp. L-8-3]|uniref:TetR/AcrR family transcriptional regulator n=1 Tax=Mesorhizobium sp. L-8-3 TaxID=2744522 RepID=UPI001928ADBF|nr:TetR/AcrR family transcriptional regulator [Mesorhizobium sp. L-8-3]BCH27707.1 TetR family transcriptional regulator [Mesorhizobium sp. L-8-3]